jgi:putative FmdB family regulatory protein
MPLYDYRCPECGTAYEARHSMQETAPACPQCGHAEPQRIITKAPKVAGGMMTHPGDGHTANKEQLKDKWAEETPKLRQKLVDKLGEDFVSRNAPSLNTGSSDS